MQHTHLLHQIRGTLGQEEHSDEQQQRGNGTDSAEHTPIDVGADQVDQEDAHREEQLEEGAQSPANRRFADLRDEHGGDDTGAAGRNARKDTGSVQPGDIGGGHRQHPGDEEGNAQQHARVLPAQLIGEDSRGNGTDKGANGQQGANP